MRAEFKSWLCYQCITYINGLQLAELGLQIYVTAYLNIHRIKQYRLIPTSQHGKPPVHIPQCLQDSKFVFVRRDGHRTSLERPYEGPFEVIKSDPKTPVMNINGKHKTITIDRLKPAHTDLEHSSTTSTTKSAHQQCSPKTPHSHPSKAKVQPCPPKPQYTRSGRKIKLPQRYA